MDTPRRSFAKAVIWELTGIMTMLIVGMLTVKNQAEVSKMTFLFYGIRFFMFFGHEQLWTRYIKWGKVHRHETHNR